MREEVYLNSNNNLVVIECESPVDLTGLSLFPNHKNFSIDIDGEEHQPID